MLKIHNTLTGKKEEFIPLEEGKIRIYVCGMTVYDYCHLGHARMFVIFDMVTRYLRARGFDVTYVRNITDIDDKIIKRAAENNEPIQSLTERIIKANREDEAALNILPPDLEPRATDHIEQIIELISQLIEKGYAYPAANGDVFFDVSAFPEYGRLSHKNIEDLQAGARVDIQEAKDDPLDFALWKAAKPGEPSWDSPWGNGRPGWHIECSAMSMHALGQHFDIHGGGMDLMFPHHENEIAQSCCATGQPFVNLWMHNGFLRIEDEKMSKSLGNFFTIKDVLKKYSAEVVRFFLLSSHYRSPLNFSEVNLEEARAALAGLYVALRGIETKDTQLSDSYVTDFNTAMDDDFNTPRAIAVLHDLAHALNRLDNKTSAEALSLAATMRHLGDILGLLQLDPDRYLQSASPGSGEAGMSDEQIEALIEERRSSRQNRDFKRADEVRDQLTEAGILLEDGPQGTTWRRG